MPTDELFLNGEEKMEKAVASLKKEFASIRTGRALLRLMTKL